VLGGGVSSSALVPRELEEQEKGEQRTFASAPQVTASVLNDWTFWPDQKLLPWTSVRSSRCDEMICFMMTSWRMAPTTVPSVCIERVVRGGILVYLQGEEEGQDARERVGEVAQGAGGRGREEESWTH